MLNARVLLHQDKKYGRTRRELLHEEYVEGSKRGGIGQPQHGFMVSRSIELGLTPAAAGA